MTARCGRSRGGDRIDRGDSGILTLEWLIIFAAIASLAAAASLIVQRVVDDTAEPPHDPLLWIAQAEVMAAEVSAEAQRIYDGPTVYTDALHAAFKDSCERVVTDNFDAGIGQGALSDPRDSGAHGVARCIVIPGQLVTG